MKSKKILYILIPIIILAASLSAKLLFSNFYFLNSPDETEAAAPRTGLTLDLNFGNNDGASAPTVYDTSGFSRHATSTAGSTSPTCGQKACDFDGTDYMTVSSTGVFNSSNLAIAFKFSPDFATSAVTQYMFFQTHSTGGYTLIFRGDGGLGWSLGGTEMSIISLASYQPYWKQARENVFIINGTSGNTKVYLNGNLIKTATTAWTAGNPTYITVGAYASKLYPFDGKIHYLKVWNRLLTDAEVATLSADRKTYTAAPTRTASSTASSGGQLVGWWTMDANDVNGTNYYDKSGFGNTATSTGSPTIATGKIKQGINIQTGASNNLHFFFAQTEGSNVYTFSYWFKAISSTAFEASISQNSTSSNWWIIMKSGVAGATGGYVKLSTSGGANQEPSGTGSRSTLTNLFDGNWHNLVLTIDDNQGKIWAWVDNVNKMNGTAYTLGTGLNFVGQMNLGIAGFGGGAGAVNQTYDDIRVYNYALSAQEVANLYNAAKTNYSVTPPREGLVGYWTMDANDLKSAGTSSSTLDKSGFGNHGTFYGFHSSMSPTSTQGKINQAINFDGSNGYVNMGDPAVYDFGTGSFTISAWVKTPTSWWGGVAFRGIIDKTSGLAYGNVGDADGPAIGIISTGRFAGFYDGISTNTAFDEPIAELKLNTWYFVTMVYNSSTGGSLYRDSVLKETNATISTTNSNAYNLNIGRCDAAAGRNYSGLIDDVRIYNRALSAQEVANLYNSAKRDYQ